MTRFAVEFIMIPPDGEKMDYPTVSRFFHRAGATRPGLHVVVDRTKVIGEQRDGAAMRYRESQTLTDGSENVR